MSRCSIVIPAFNEGPEIINVLSRLNECVTIEFECIIVVDFKEDSTIQSFENTNLPLDKFRIEISNFPPGPANAIKYGISLCESNVIVVTMADGSDDPRNIPDLVRLVERGVVIASASRYMPGGQQIGAPFFKGVLSKTAGISLHILKRIGTHDVTNSFKAYSANFLRSIEIESKHGFEMALELVAKASRKGLPIAELPTIWIEQDFRKSHFRLFSWLPRYLKWYLFALGIGK
jgi:glycosyltransferase involved in cell wall biosynthesis